MSPEEVKLNIEQPGLHIIKFGSLPQDREPRPVIISGTISAVSDFLKARSVYVNSSHSNIIIDEEIGTIILTVDERSFHAAQITGSLMLSNSFTKWGINTEKQYSSLDLAHMIKMNRFMFPSTAQAMELVSVFQSLKAKVQKEVELSDDKRGNKTNLQSQVVLNLSIPTGFTIKTEIFKGLQPKEFEVEIAINADSLNIQLVSPAVNDIINRVKKELIQEQIMMIESFNLELVPIIYR